VTVARVEIGTDEHRCGIEPLTGFVSRNWPLQSVCARVGRSRYRFAPRQKCRPHPTMDRPPVSPLGSMGGRSIRSIQCIGGVKPASAETQLNPSIDPAGASRERVEVLAAARRRQRVELT